jgi:hypothetical protein
MKFDDTKKVPVIKQVKDVVENINLVQVNLVTIDVVACRRLHTHSGSF